MYAQVETEPQVDYFPTFGWLDYSTMGIDDSSSEAPEQFEFTVSQNPLTGSVTIQTNDTAQLQLRVYDIAGREVSAISVSNGVGVWNGTGFFGERLPTGVYNIVAESGFSHRITLLAD